MVVNSIGLCITLGYLSSLIPFHKSISFMLYRENPFATHSFLAFRQFNQILSRILLECFHFLNHSTSTLDYQEHSVNYQGWIQKINGLQKIYRNQINDEMIHSSKWDIYILIDKYGTVSSKQ